MPKLTSKLTPRVSAAPAPRKSKPRPSVPRTPSAAPSLEHYADVQSFYSGRNVAFRWPDASPYPTAKMILVDDYVITTNGSGNGILALSQSPVTGSFTYTITGNTLSAAVAAQCSDYATLNTAASKARLTGATFTIHSLTTDNQKKGELYALQAQNVGSLAGLVTDYTIRARALSVPRDMDVPMTFGYFGDGNGFTPVTASTFAADTFMGVVLLLKGAEVSTASYSVRVVRSIEYIPTAAQTPLVDMDIEPPNDRLLHYIAATSGSVSSGKDRAGIYSALGTMAYGGVMGAAAMLRYRQVVGRNQIPMI